MHHIIDRYTEVVNITNSVNIKGISNNGDTLFCAPSGLSDAEVSENRKKHGKNVITRKRSEGFFEKFFKSFNDPIIKILIGALIINAAASFGRINWPETIGIMAAILISTLVSTISEYTSSLAYQRLSQEGNGTLCFVRRNGVLMEIPTDEIVFGDRVILSAGMKIPCDGFLLSGELSCDQSSLTGESREAKKQGLDIFSIDPHTISPDPADYHQVFSQCTVTKGCGEMVALKVGDSTMIGTIARDLQENPRPSPLKNRLSELARSIGIMGYIGAVLIAAAYLFNSFFIDSGMDMALVRARFSDTPFLLSEILRAVTIAVSCVVVAVPEGLPMMITVILSSNMKKMMKGGVLVRRLVGIETAGNLNVLFTDKTGTLTTGKMSVISLSGVDWRGDRTKKKMISNIELIERCISSTCTPYGNATERALLSFIKKSESEAERIPFDSKKKFSAGLTRGAAYFTGAPEIILSYCYSFIDSGGCSCALDNSSILQIYDNLSELADSAYRVICLALGDRSAFEEAKCGRPLSGLTFIALCALRDPLRRDIKSSVSDCKRAGIHVVMVTGDNSSTAKAIATEAGIIDEQHSIILEASELHTMDDDKVIGILPSLSVVSRALPSDKIRLVRLSQSSGLTVGMTGDGINDAPALKAADVGFAMGSGSDIAKDAGDIVITDDSFSSITRAVLYGRTIFRSIRKFIVFQLLMNLSAMGISLIGPFIGIDSPVTVIQMLWVNIIMDTLGGLAFAGEPAMKSYMLRACPPREEKLISRDMLSQILITGGYTLLLGIYFLKSSFTRSLFSGGDTYFLTAFFAMFIFCGIFNSFNARSEKTNILHCIAGNKPFVFIMALVCLIQLLIIYFGGEIFRCTPLSPIHLLYCAIIAFTVIPADILRKFFFSKKGRKA